MARAHHDDGHGQGYGHPHAHHGGGTRRALAAALALNGVFLIVEALVGWWSGSLVLLSDAAHMLGDVAALGLALVAAILADRPSTPKRTFGFLRAEALGAFLNALAMMVVVGFIAFEAFRRISTEVPEIPGWPVLGIATGGLLINVGSVWFLWRSDRSNINIRGALIHMWADALGSIGAIVAACAVLTGGWYIADPIASLIIAVLVLFGAWGVLGDSTAQLLAFAPPGLDAERVIATLCELDGVGAAHDVHVWSIGSGGPTITLHVVPDADRDAFGILERVQACLHDRFGVEHATVQIDPPNAGCVCTLLTDKQAS